MTGACIKVCCGRREAILWIDPETMEYRVLRCNWFKECIKRGVLMGGHCPAYCDLISSAKHYVRGRKRRNVEARFLSPQECEVIKAYNPQELLEQSYNADFEDISDKIDGINGIDNYI